MRKQVENKMSGPTETKRSLEQRVEDLEALLDSDVKFRARRMGLNPNALTREEYSRLHHDATVSKDPITPAEAKVYAKFEGPIAEAAEAEEKARQSFEDAHQAWSVAHVEQGREARKLGDVKFTTHGEMIVPSGSPYAAAKARTAELYEEREEAGRVLEKAKLKYSKYVFLREHALRAARDGGRGVLESIRDRVLG